MKRTFGNIKFCPKCKKEEEFSKHKNRKDGLSTWCKKCQGFYYIRNREKLLEQKRKFYIENPEIFLERNRQNTIKHNKKTLLDRAKRRAKLKNVPFTLTLSDINIPELCPVLGIPIQINEGYSKYNSISIDRIIPELGYVKDNIIVVSLKANQIKNCSNIEELEKVYTFYKTLIESKK